MSRTFKAPDSKRPTKKVRPETLNRKVRADEREALHKAVYFGETPDLGVPRRDLFWLFASKIP